MAENKLTLKEQLPQQFNEAQISFIQKRTPPAFIKTRAGRGGGTFNYVEIGYVMEMLNSLFGFGAWDWEYELVAPLSYPHTEQIVVNGKLTIRVYDPAKQELRGTIVKTASGGGTVKFLQNSKTPVDLADELKSASADALKKAASMIGIAGDVYYPNVYKAIEHLRSKKNVAQGQPTVINDEEMHTQEAEAIVLEAEEEESPNERVYLQRSIFAIAKELAIKGKINLVGKTDEQKKEAIKEFLKQYAITIKSFADDPIDTLKTALNQLQELNK